MSVSIELSDTKRIVTLCNHNYSHEGIYHPDRIMQEYDLLYMVQGNWEIYEENTPYTVGPHQVLLLEPGKHHYSLQKCSSEMKNVYIHFDLIQSDTTSLALDSLVLNKITDCSRNHTIFRLFEQIISRFWSNSDPYRELRLSALLDTLLLELSDLHRADNKQTDILMTEIVHRIHCTPERFFSQEELAADYDISVRTLSNRFKKTTGYSLHQYQLMIKLDMAYDNILLSPGRGLHDLATSFGFYDEFQFSKLFKRRFGISPSEHRHKGERK